MSVRWFELEPIPSMGWLKRKKVCGWLLERADPQSAPVTLDSGRLELRYADLNSLGARGGVGILFPLGLTSWASSR